MLYTGGTIGMVRNKDGVLVPQPHAMENKIRAMCTMHDEVTISIDSRHFRKVFEQAREWLGINIIQKVNFVNSQDCKINNYLQ